MVRELRHVGVVVVVVEEGGFGVQEQLELVRRGERGGGSIRVGEARPSAGMPWLVVKAKYLGLPSKGLGLAVEGEAGGVLLLPQAS